MERCPACGQTYGLTHACPGAIAATSSALVEQPAPTGFAPAYYFRQAIGIARFDDGAILRGSRDPKALFYGIAIWLFGQLLATAAGVFPVAARGYEVNWLRVAMGIPILIAFSAVWALLQYAICHLLGRWWFGATGTYMGVLRAMLLGSMVLWAIVIPYVGTIIAGLWSIAVLMRVFEEVDGIERMKAYGLAFVVGLCFWALTFTFLVPKG